MGPSKQRRGAAGAAKPCSCMGATQSGAPTQHPNLEYMPPPMTACNALPTLLLCLLCFCVLAQGSACQLVHKTQATDAHDNCTTMRATTMKLSDRGDRPLPAADYGDPKPASRRVQSASSCKG